MKAFMDPPRHRQPIASSTDDGNDASRDQQRRLEKSLRRLEFKLDRAVKEKQTLSTLLARTSEDLEKSSEIIKKMFGRYISTEVMDSLLEDPAALELGGEQRSVSIMMTDLRGFSELSERLSPADVVKMLNTYFEVMVDIVLSYNGTINEIIGDALLVIFGAPQHMEDRTERAVACAIEMQNAMPVVNDMNRREGLPRLEMGIGINETEVIVGNIGSSKRSKYAAVGSGVNITSRIESYSVGGQILVTESVNRKIGHLLRIDAQQHVNPKGSPEAIRIYEVSGIAGRYHQALEIDHPPLNRLGRPIPIHYLVLEGKRVSETKFSASLIRLSTRCADIQFKQPVAATTNLQMELAGVNQALSAKPFYGKVFQSSGLKGTAGLVRFTSIPPEIDAFFEAHLQYAVE